jgi:N6-adenosine-specific RNA methylase IME4
MSLYNIIYADPPWFYKDNASSGERGAEFKYPLMRDDEIANLDVESIAADDAALFLWATKPKIDVALWVLRKWGFIYKTFAFDWIKLSKKGDPKFGMGHWTRANAEHVLLGIRGQPQRKSGGVSSVIMTTTGRHSEKPDKVRDDIVKLMGDVPRVELFARKRVPGWDALGYDVGTGDIKKTLGMQWKERL